MDQTETPINKTDDEWQAQLTPEQYDILRRAGTERPFTGRYVDEKADGMYACAGCGADLFAADTKFDSGTGWPSFTDSEPGGVEMRREFSMGGPRTEVLCRRCGGHLGHVFNDGPEPEGKRYCINACALERGEAADPRS